MIWYKYLLVPLNTIPMQTNCREPISHRGFLVFLQPEFVSQSLDGFGMQ